MWGIVLVTLALLAALVGIFKDRKSADHERALAFGLSRAGVMLLAFSVLTGIAGIIKEVTDSVEKTRLLDERRESIRALKQDLAEARDEVGKVRAQLRAVAHDQAIASTEVQERLADVENLARRSTVPVPYEKTRREVSTDWPADLPLESVADVFPGQWLRFEITGETSLSGKVEPSRVNAVIEYRDSEGETKRGVFVESAGTVSHTPRGYIVAHGGTVRVPPMPEGAQTASFKLLLRLDKGGERKGSGWHPAYTTSRYLHNSTWTLGLKIVRWF